MIISCPSCGASFNVQAEALGPAGRTVKCSKCAYRWRALPDGTAADELPATPAVAESPVPAAMAAAPEPAPAAPAETPDIAAAGAQADRPDAGAAVAEPDSAPEASDPPTPSFQLRDTIGDVSDGDSDDAGARRRRGGPRPRQPARKPRGAAAKVISLFVLILLISGVVGVATLLKQQVMMWLPATQRLYAMIGVTPEFLGRGLQIVEPKPKKEVDGNDQILVVEGEVRNTTTQPIDVPLMRGALLDKTGKELHIWTFTAAKSRIAPGETARYRTEFRNPPPAAESLDITFTRADNRMDTATQDANARTEAPPAAPKAH